jgi:hypothetical protein
VKPRLYKTSIGAVSRPPAKPPWRRPPYRRIRWACNEALCHLGPALRPGSRWAWLLEVSAGGAGLLLTENMPAGTRLALELAPLVGVLQALVVHNSYLGDGAWLVGCRFDEALSEDALRALARS